MLAALRAARFEMLADDFGEMMQMSDEQRAARYLRHVRKTRCSVLSAAVLMSSLWVTGEARAQDFWIDEATDFTGNGCPNDDVNTVTKSLRSELVNNSWIGDRMVNADAWPQDFTESCNDALFRDGNDIADLRLLTVYAGHGFREGNKSGVQFGTARAGLCSVTFATSRRPEVGTARLGQMAHARAGFSAWITSCSMGRNFLAEGINFQWVNQNFGFDNSPAIEASQPKDWFRAIGSKSNKEAWLDEMEDKQGLFTGDNNPIVVSYSSTSSLCTDMHNNKRLKAQILKPRGGGPTCGAGLPAFIWCATMRSNEDTC
jgi:hypothetical protein